MSVKEAQALARHATPEMTVNVYGRVREDGLSDAVEKVAENIIVPEKRVRYVSKLAMGAETESATPLENKELRSLQMVEAAGIEPRPWAIRQKSKR